MNISSIKNLEFKIQNNLSTLHNLNFSTTELLVLVIFGCISLGLLAYAIILLLNGFRYASKPTKWQHYFGFVLVLILSEFISKLIISAMI